MAVFSRQDRGLGILDQDPLVGPVHDLEPAVHVLDQRGQALDPVPSLQYSVPLMTRISARWIWPQTTPSRTRLRASAATADSKLLMKLTAPLTRWARYCDSDQ